MNTTARPNGYENSPAPAVNKQEMQAALDRVLSSKHFVHAPMKQRFLRLICEFHLSGRGGELNEYLIGREVFDRDGSYNPATDPIVRVGAHGVREKLERYYQKDGAQDDVKIEIPVGSYEPNFIRTAPPVAEPVPVEESVSEAAHPIPIPGLQESPAKGFHHYWPQMAAGLLGLLILGLAYSNFSLRQEVAAAAQRQNQDAEFYQPVWQAFLNSSDPTLVVLSNPPVFRFINSADPAQVIKNSVPISTEQTQNIFSGIQNKSIIRIINNPRLTMTTDTYTGIGEAIGVHHITDLFRGREKSLTLKQSRTVSAEDLKSQNIVALGSIWVNNWSNKLQFKQDFVYTNQVSVENLNPLPGEQREYRPIFDEQTGELTEEYALITVGPNTAGRSGQALVMVLAGLHSEGTAAAAEFVTSKRYLTRFNQQLATAGQNGKPPKHYQALLKVNVDNGIPTTITLVSIHELGQAAQ